jgi:hypothetical protein
MNVCIIPRSIFFTTLNGFPKIDINIVVKFVKLYKTISLEDTLIPLVMDQANGHENEIATTRKCEFSKCQLD